MNFKFVHGAIKYHVQTTFVMPKQKAILTQDEMDIVNDMFALDLDYSNATHYRAAQVIWNLWKADGSDINVGTMHSDDPEEM